MFFSNVRHVDQQQPINQSISQSTIDDGESKVIFSLEKLEAQLEAQYVREVYN
jgi:hypothetical protein